MKVGILGAGGIAHKMAYTLTKMDGVECAAIASRSLEKAKAFAEEFGIKKAYGSYEELAADSEIGLVYVATPHSEHFAHAMLCLENGRNVLCEKAFTANAAQAEKLIALAEEKGLLLAEAIWTRYIPMRRKLDELLESGVIGKVTFVTANVGYVIESVDRLTNPALAGGALLDVGVYPINFASMVLGTEIERVTSDCVKTDSGVDRQCMINLAYKSGAAAQLFATMSANTDLRGMVYGEKGSIEAVNINNCEQLIVKLNDGTVTVYDRPEQITGFEYQAASAIKAVEDGKTECEEMPHAETLRIMRLMDRLRSDWGIRYPFE